MILGLQNGCQSDGLTLPFQSLKARSGVYLLLKLIIFLQFSYIDFSRKCGPKSAMCSYLAPEFLMHGIVDEKTDVFSFGVLLLELITGRRALDYSQQSLVMWVRILPFELLICFI